MHQLRFVSITMMQDFWLGIIWFCISSPKWIEDSDWITPWLMFLHGHQFFDESKAVIGGWSFAWCIKGYDWTIYLLLMFWRLWLVDGTLLDASKAMIGQDICDWWIDESQVVIGGWNLWCIQGYDWTRLQWRLYRRLWLVYLAELSYRCICQPQFMYILMEFVTHRNLQHKWSSF